MRLRISFLPLLIAAAVCHGKSSEDFGVVTNVNTSLQWLLLSGSGKAPMLKPSETRGEAEGDVSHAKRHPLGRGQRFLEGEKQRNRGVHANTKGFFSRMEQQHKWSRRLKPIPAAEVCRVKSDIEKRYHDGCNWCRCSSIGAAACTKKACPMVPHGHVLSRTREVSPTVACKLMRDFKRSYFDGCKQCTCVGLGEARCTKKACSEVILKPYAFDTTKAKVMCRGNPQRLKMYYNSPCRRCSCVSNTTAWCYDIHRRHCAKEKAKGAQGYRLRVTEEKKSHVNARNHS